jgi:hypothetical protein
MNDYHTGFVNGVYLIINIKHFKLIKQKTTIKFPNNV